MKFQDSSFNGLKVTVGTKSVTHARTHALTDAPKAICPINFFKVGSIKIGGGGGRGRVGGGQGGCERRIEVFFENSKKNGGGGLGGRVGGSEWM